jgi:NAD-dependent dihydropyrimidine dehydrogenase PreA subunit
MKATISLFTYDCTGCGRCIRACHKHVLKMIDNGMARFINTINEDDCTGCGRCESACENDAIKITGYL